MMEHVSWGGQDGYPLDKRIVDGIKSIRRDGRPDVLRKVVNCYLGDAEKSLQVLRTAIVRRDASGIGRTAHCFSSSSAHVGAMRLAMHNRRLETAAAAGSLDGIEETLAAIESEFQLVRTALLDECQELSHRVEELTGAQ
jgi:HPt (histidine-containing phosphotransfer) domain-containing protein